MTDCRACLKAEQCLIDNWSSKTIDSLGNCSNFVRGWMSTSRDEEYTRQMFLKNMSEKHMDIFEIQRQLASLNRAMQTTTVDLDALKHEVREISHLLKKKT